MPLEIKELHIKVSVNQTEQTGNQSSASKKAGDDKDAILSECIEEVIKIINNKKER